MSSRVNLSSLVDHINGLTETYLSEGDEGFGEELPSIDPELKFKILQSCAARGAHPPLSSHISECFFSFDVSTEELKKLGRRSLRSKVDSAFINKLSAYAALLQRKTFDIPEEVLYVLLPFLYGDSLTNPMLNDIVAKVGELMGTTTKRTTATTSTTMPTTATALSSETRKKSRKTAKRRVAMLVGFFSQFTSFSHFLFF